MFMLEQRSIFSFLLILCYAFCFQIAYSQNSEETKRQLLIIEKEYNDLLQSALKSQVKADSLARISNLKRWELESVRDESKKAKLGSEVLEIERESLEIQTETNKKYATARDLELRLLSLKRSMPETPSGSQANQQVRSGEVTKDEKLLLAFFYGKPELEPFIGPMAIEKLKSVEKQAYNINRIFNEVSETNQEIENLKIQIDTNPRSRKNKNYRKQIEELEKKASLKNSEALSAIEGVNKVKLEVLVDVVNASKVRVSSRDLLQKASVHENSAEENIREAIESRKVANELRTEKFSHDYMIRAYQKELVAIEELMKAFTLFTGKSSTQVDLMSERTSVGISPPKTQTTQKEETITEKNRESMQQVSETKSEKIIENGTVIPLNISLPAGLTYRIQVGIYLNDAVLPDFKDLPNLTRETDEGHGTTRYFSGIYARFGEAERALLDVRKLGFRDAFIAAYLDSRRIPVNRAISMEGDREEKPAVVVAAENKPILVAEVKESKETTEKTTGNVVFKVQIGVFRNLLTSENRDRFLRLAGNQKMEFSQNNSGLYVYTIGIFNTFEQAVQTRDKLVSGGIKDAFVVAYKNGEKIPLNQVIK